MIHNKKIQLILDPNNFPINYPVYYLIAQRYEYAKDFAKLNNWNNIIWRYVNNIDCLRGIEGFIVYVGGWYQYHTKIEYDKRFWDELDCNINLGRLSVIKESYTSLDYAREYLNQY